MGAGGDQRVSDVMGHDTVPNRDQRFERLVEQYQEAVLRTCFLCLCDETLAEDATQETLLKVYRTMDSFRGESSEKTWILKIAMPACFDINHSGWFRFMYRRVTPEMLPVFLCRRTFRMDTHFQPEALNLDVFQTGVSPSSLCSATTGAAARLPRKTVH